MVKNIVIMLLVAAVLVSLVFTAGQLVLQGSTALALVPVVAALTAIFFYIRRIAN
ncbi:MAG: hypothetical protein AAGJ37_00790 [Pseudomonadota bacterium]